MLKNFDEWNYRGATKKDQTEIKKWLKRDIPLSIDDIGGVHTEEGVYIANAVYDAENGVGIEMQNESWGGKRQNAGRPATGAKPNRTFRLSDAEYEAVKEFIKNLRSESKMRYELRMKVETDGTISRNDDLQVLINDAEGMFKKAKASEIENGDTLEIYDREQNEVVWERTR